MRKIIAAIFMGLIILGGVSNVNVCNAAGSQDIVQWYYRSYTMQESIANTIDITTDVVSYFMHEGYAPRDIVMAGLLAGQNTNASVHVGQINRILAKKTSNTSWRDVAIDMGIEQETFNQYAEKAKNVI